MAKSTAELGSVKSNTHNARFLSFKAIPSPPPAHQAQPGEGREEQRQRGGAPMSALEPTPVANPRIWVLPPSAKNRHLVLPNALLPLQRCHISAVIFQAIGQIIRCFLREPSIWKVHQACLYILKPLIEVFDTQQTNHRAMSIFKLNL